MRPPIADLEDFAALEPFFNIVKEGLRGFVEADHFFDLFAENAVTEYVVTVPGYPPRIESRAALAELYRPYGTRMIVERCFDLTTHHDPQKNVVVLEYACEGHAVESGNPYRNHFISVITLEDGQIVHWRDYLNPVAVFDALGWPAAVYTEPARASLSQRR